MAKKSSQLLSELLQQVNQKPETPLRLADWSKSIKWAVDGESFFWEVRAGLLYEVGTCDANIVLNCTQITLSAVVERRLPLFIAIWVTGDVQFQGSFADAYRLGYLFLDDARKRKVVFLAHCFLNINTRFPQGCAFAGANVPVINTLLKHDLGIVQMPCPEFLCMGLEKELYGEIPESELMTCFRNIAAGVIDQIEAYLKLGYEIAGVIGMNPSPSCGVNVSKGKGTMLGLDRDTSEKEESGVFMEELMALAAQRGIVNLPFFGIRRVLPGENGTQGQLQILESYLSQHGFKQMNNT
jgi:predicted secreted protein